MALATSGAPVRASTELSRLGTIRSNDQAKMLRVAARKEGGSVAIVARMNEIPMRAIRSVECVSMETKKKKKDGASNGYCLLPLLDRYVAEPRKSLPNVRAARA